MSCIGCNQALTLTKANDEKLVSKAVQMAKESGEAVALYRNEEGQLCIASSPGFPIIRIITPQYQNA